MSRFPAILLITSALGLPGCKIHRLPSLPPERDPADERAAIVPYRAPPDVLTTELSTGEGAPAGHEHHHGHGAPAEPSAPADPHAGHDHAGHGGGE